MNFQVGVASTWNNVLLSNDRVGYNYGFLIENEHYGKTEIRGEYKYDMDLGDFNLLKEEVFKIIVIFLTQLLACFPHKIRIKYIKIISIISFSPLKISNTLLI